LSLNQWIFLYCHQDQDVTTWQSKALTTKDTKEHKGRTEKL
jgi:hypothetical protein